MENNKAVLKFEEVYGKAPTGLVFTPFRVCPIGAHSDYGLGKVTGFAINKGIYLAYGPKKSGLIELRSCQFDKRAQWHVMEVPPTKEGDWADYLRGATISLNNRYPLRHGICGVINGEFPIGGLSSSAAVTITFLRALSSMNGINLQPEELIEIAKEAENQYVGVACGRMDQSCEVYCQKDHLLYLDTKDGSHELIKVNPNAPKFKIAIFFSGLERSLANSGLNTRVDELKSAAYALKAFSGMEYGKYRDTFLRDVPYETYLKYKDRLPLNWRKRAEHWYTEFQRVEKGAKLFAEGDLVGFGKLSFESGWSSIHNWETGSPELIKLYEIMTHTKGIFGGRFSGAGFKGCCMAIIDPTYEKEILENVEKEYLEAFPNLKGKYVAAVCETADGVES